MACYKLVNNQKSKSHPQIGSPMEKWQTPEQGCLKLNWVAALCASTKTMGVGAVVRDDLGIVRATIRH
jgi:hypothetical protein